MTRPKHVFCLVVLACGAVSAQTITGTWQGTLPVAENPRVSLKITKAADGSLHGTRYQLDKSAEGISLSSVTFTAPDFSIEQIYAGFSFHGKLSVDGRSIEGAWNDGKQTYPLTFTLATPETLWKREVPPAMAADANPSFEVATIKPSAPDSKGAGFMMRTRQFTAPNHTVQELIKFAYNLRDRQIQGGPAWFAVAKFDIAGEPDAPGLPSEQQYRLMVKKLLADRFHLTTHSIQQVFPLYALTWDRNAPPLPVADPEFRLGSIYVKGIANDQTLLRFVGHTIPMFADILMNFIKDRQVVDQTGLTGRFEFTLTYPTGVLNGSDDEEKANAFMRALQPLGFKLTPKREPIEVIVVDHLDRPTAN